MAHIVKLSNGETLEFPDEMTEQQMHEAIQANYPVSNYAPKREPVSWKKFLADALGGGSLGVLQGVSDVGANIAQIPGDIFGYKAPRPNLRGYGPESNAGRIAENIGEFAGHLPLALAAPESLGSSLLSKAAIGSLAGGASSENRGAGAAFGALGGALPSAFNLAKSSTSKNIAKKFAEDKADVKAQYAKQYGDLFKKAAEEGITTVTKPRINISAIEDSGMPRQYKSLKQFLENPTLENAHWAQSGLGGLERKLEKVSEGAGLTPPQNKALLEVKKAKQKIQDAMFAKHKLGSKPELAKTYADLAAGYKAKVVPWNSAKGLEDFSRGELTAKDLINKLSNNKKFMAQLGNQYPQLKINRIADNPWVKSLILGTLGLEGAHKAKQVFFD